ncbi:unnamed protein product [Blepharisma stoltei]|uniref:Ankyrin repeat protein n=1 Tax=Blepharisma stoltei TaxID=1481888 RepID=A0AAU9JY24_9CILI|nr:unnamed protein product [Blepharisma stoltei]
MKSPLKLSFQVKKILKKNDLQNFKKIEFKRGGVYGSERKTILHLAAKYCTNHTIPKYLIKKKKVQLDTKTKKSLSTALHYACRSGNWLIAKYLLKCGCDINRLRRGNQSSILLSVRYNWLGITKLLISKKADIKIKDKRNWNLAHWASYNGNLKMLHLLEKSGVSLHDVTDNGETCLHLGVWSGNLECVKYLLTKISIWESAKNGSILEYCRGNWSLLSWLLFNTKWSEVPVLEILLSINCPRDLILKHVFNELNISFIFRYDRDDLLNDIYEKSKVPLEKMLMMNMPEKCKSMAFKLIKWGKVKGLIFIYLISKKNHMIFGKIPKTLIQEMAEYLE